MAQHFDICIRGAGIVGQTLALLLAQARLRVALVDSAARSDGHKLNSAVTPDIRAYSLNATSRQLLLSLRGWPDDAVCPITAMQVWGDDRGEVNFCASDCQVESLAWMVDVPALEAQLTQAVRFQPLIERLTASDLSHLTATLTVICEGRASTTRAELGVEFDITSYHQSAIATRLTCERVHGGIARQWFGAESILAFLPLPHDAIAVVWSVNSDLTDDLLALSQEEFAQRLEAASHLALGRLTLSHDRAAWPLQLAQAKRWTGRTAQGLSWALAGDAAHNVHPLAGQGLNLGLGDAAELARLLGQRDYWRPLNDAKLLRQYERARQADVLSMGLTTDGLQRLFAHHAPGWRALRNHGMNGFERSGFLKRWVAKRAMNL